jgi:hypothetical protein
MVKPKNFRDTTSTATIKAAAISVAPQIQTAKREKYSNRSCILAIMDCFRGFVPDGTAELM